MYTHNTHIFMHYVWLVWVIVTESLEVQIYDYSTFYFYANLVTICCLGFVFTCSVQYTHVIVMYIYYTYSKYGTWNFILLYTIFTSTKY